MQSASLRLGWLLLGSVLATLPVSADAIGDSVKAPHRTPADLERDLRSHPAEILRFAGLKPGMTVLDLFGGAGYYSEIIGRVVGPEGKVYLHNNIAYQSFVRKALNERFAQDEMVNVVRYDAEIGELGIEDESVDLVLMTMTYHDLYYKTEGWDIDPISFFGEIYHLMKPGAVLLIVDHAAAADSGNRPAQLLHRIDEKFAQEDIQSRGFKYAGALDVLRNATDDHTKSVFDPEVRGKTDRFVHKYIKLPLMMAE